MLHELRQNPALLKLDLYCKGLRLDESCLVLRTRSDPDGLGGGLELILPGNLWINVPVTEGLAARSPYSLHREHGRHLLRWERLDVTPVEVAPRPGWYGRATATGRPMTRIGTLRGTYLEIDASGICNFCSAGSLDEMLEVARAARDESGIIYVELDLADCTGEIRLDLLDLLVIRIKRELGLLVGLRRTPFRPVQSHDLQIDHQIYNRLREMGINRVSFRCDLPGDLDGSLETIRHCASLSRRGPRHEPWDTHGEIIAGLEPPESSIRAIDSLTSAGAVPTVRVFRPLPGTDLQHLKPPETENMVPVFRHLYEAVMERGLPTGIAPNIHASLVMLPEECRYLSPNRYRWQSLKLRAMATLFARQLERRLSHHL